MIVKKSSRGNGRNVTPMRVVSSINIRTCVPKLSGSSRRGRQRCKLNAFGFKKDRLVKPGGRYPNGRSLTSGSRRGHRKVMTTASASKDSSQDSTSIIMPSGVSSFLLDCLDADSTTLNMDSTLSSIEEFRRVDHFDEGITIVDGNGMMNSVKNSTLLDLSHAQDIALHQPPNLSSILELSLDIAEHKQKNSLSLSPISLSPLCVPSETLASGFVFKPDEKRTPVNGRAVGLFPVVKKQCVPEKETNKPIKCRKVMFSDIVSIRNISNHRRNKIDHHHYGVQEDKLVKQKEGITREVQHMESQDISSGPAKFFDFADECEREAFFQRLKQTYSFQFPAKTRVSILSPPSKENKTRGSSISSLVSLRLRT